MQDDSETAIGLDSDADAAAARYRRLAAPDRHLERRRVPRTRICPPPGIMPDVRGAEGLGAWIARESHVNDPAVTAAVQDVMRAVPVPFAPRQVAHYHYLTGRDPDPESAVDHVTVRLLEHLDYERVALDPSLPIRILLHFYQRADPLRHLSVNELLHVSSTNSIYWHVLRREPLGTPPYWRRYYALVRVILDHWQRAVAARNGSSAPMPPPVPLLPRAYARGLGGTLIQRATVRELAAQMGVEKRRLYTWRSQGLPPRRAIQMRFAIDALRAWVAREAPPHAAEWRDRLDSIWDMFRLDGYSEK